MSDRFRNYPCGMWGDMETRISVVGLGKLGLNLAACMASRGLQVLGVDIDLKMIAQIERGEPPTFEPGLRELLGCTVGKTLKLTDDVARCVDETSITFILVQTPSMPDGRYGTGALRSVLVPLCRSIRNAGKIGHAIVVCSTIQPGTFRDTILPIVQQESGFRDGDGIEVAYNPELVALGSTIRNFMAPDFVLIGADHPGVARRVAAIQQQLTTNNPPIHVMSLPSAELVKLCLNTYLTLKISFANLVGQLASQIEGTEIDKICAAIGDDKRIGQKYLKSGPSFGGTCFPRDVRAFLRFCDDVGEDTTLPTAIGNINHAQDTLLEELSLAALEGTNNRKVGILGMAFKPGTSVIDESPATKLAASLLRHGYQVAFYDPECSARVSNVLGPGARAVGSATACVDAASVIVLHHPIEEYRIAILDATTRLHAVIDCWGALADDTLPSNVWWLRLGNPVDVDGGVEIRRVTS